MKNLSEYGTLYLVATPIGNLEDITYRAVRVLNEVDIIAAEDTRQTIKLLNHLGIKKPMTSYFEHNKVVKGDILIKALQEGKNIALVSDAGSPGISDPGEDIVKQAIENGISVTMIPGAVAATTALVLSGLSTSRFVFEGFLPMNKRQRKERMAFLKEEVRTIILYEAPHKLLYTLKDIFEVLGDRKIATARELTKKFEEVKRQTVSSAISFYEIEKPKGEFVLIIEGANQDQLKNENHKVWEQISIVEHLQMYIDQGLDKKEAMKKVAIDRGISKREVYSATLD